MTALNVWLDKLESLDPNKIELGLDRVKAIWEKLNTGKIPKVITVTGTNGKGTCAYAVESVLRAAGKRTALYTSPHLFQFNERVQICGQLAMPDELAAAFERVDTAREGVELTYFEFTTLAALSLFQVSELDVWVLEVGLGGRLDAVNVIDADVAVVTSVALDHQDWLGDSLQSIATEKLGIAREGRPVVLGEANCTPFARLLAEQKACPVFQQGQEYEAFLETHVGRPTGWSWSGRVGSGSLALYLGLALNGLHVDSLGAAVQAVQLVFEDVTEEQIRQGLQDLDLPGRWHSNMTSQGVEVVFDVAHNPAAALALAHNLRDRTPGSKVFAVCGFAKDKDFDGFLATISHYVDLFVFTDLPGPRSWSGAEQLKQETRNALFFKRPEIALANAVARAQEGDLVLVTGSFMLVAELIDSDAYA